MMGCRDYETVANARVDALAALPVSSVVLDGRRVAWQRTFTNSWRSTMDHEVYTSELDRRYGPVTVLYDPRGGA